MIAQITLHEKSIGDSLYLKRLYWQLVTEWACLLTEGFLLTKQSFNEMICRFWVTVC